MTDFWNNKFEQEGIMWGIEPSDSALRTLNFFLKKGIRKVLIPGIGYGRNAMIFQEKGFEITGIEISEEAINLAHNKNGLDAVIHHGSVNEMPFDNKFYEGIFCYALIHLLDKDERKRFLRNCYNKLEAGGYMIFTVVSKSANMFGNGKCLGKDRYEMMPDLNVFFYEPETVKEEFEDFGLVDFHEIDEPMKHMDNEPPLKLFFVKCYKKS